MQLRMFGGAASKNRFTSHAARWCQKEICLRLGLKNYQIYEDVVVFARENGMGKLMAPGEKDIKEEIIDSEVVNKAEACTNEMPQKEVFITLNYEVRKAHAAVDTVRFL